MSRLLADEHFPVKVVYKLRKLGHDVLTVREICTNKRGDALSDETVLSFAKANKRAVLTKNVADFKQLHASYPGHFGIIGCSFSDAEDAKPVAKRIHDCIKAERNRLKGKWLRIFATPCEP